MDDYALRKLKAEHAALAGLLMELAAAYLDREIDEGETLGDVANEVRRKRVSAY